MGRLHGSRWRGERSRGAYDHRGQRGPFVLAAGATPPPLLGGLASLELSRLYLKETQATPQRRGLSGLTEDAASLSSSCSALSHFGLVCEQTSASKLLNQIPEILSFAAASPLLCSGSREKKYFLPCAPKPSY